MTTLHPDGAPATEAPARYGDGPRPTPATIVAGVEPGGPSTRAVLWAGDEAERRGVGLQLVTAISPYLGLPALTSQLRRDLGSLARRLELDAAPTCSVVEGAVREVLLRAAAAGRLLVVGRRGFATTGHLLMGSTSLAVAAEAEVPVVVVPETWNPPALHLAPVVACVEPLDAGFGVTPISDPDLPVLRFAFEQAAARRVPLVVASVDEVDRGPASARPRQDAVPPAAAGRRVGALDARLAGWRAVWPEVEVATRPLTGLASLELQHVSAAAQLTVVGRHSSRRTHHGLGSAARHLLLHAAGPVAVVPPLPRSVPQSPSTPPTEE